MMTDETGKFSPALWQQHYAEWAGKQSPEEMEQLRKAVRDGVIFGTYGPPLNHCGLGYIGQT